ncbi:MAG: sodium/glutamate symporter [Methanosarcinaceae archaeon]|mgnify:CR=1 FL=1|nr:sodium/glutamate symporter [Methanosarcinaceae archaeon]
MFLIEFDIFQSVTLAVFLLLIGKYLVGKISVLEKYSIPAPIVGGFLFSIFALVLKHYEIAMFEFDNTLQNVAMVVFFTTIGFKASFEVIKKDSKAIFLFFLCAAGLVILQNIIGVGLCELMGIDHIIGILTGSTAMTGGHGTAAAIGMDAENAGVIGAKEIGLAAATFGLVAGSVIGGPLGTRRIKKHGLKPSEKELIERFEVEEKLSRFDVFYKNVFNAAYMIIIAIGIGILVNPVLELTGLKFPIYIGPMIVAVILRNITDNGKGIIPKVAMDEVNLLGDFGLEIFLSMALMNLKLWEIADLATPMIILIIAQTILMILYAYFITFNVMGRDYDAAILMAGHCGFGMGATPNAMANMTSLTEKYGPSQKAFFVLPTVSALFIDIINIFIIGIFFNIFI